MIEILKIIASFSITIALFYTFFKVGRLIAYENLLKHFEDAVKIIGKQNAIIQAYEQKLEEIEKEAQQWKKFELNITKYNEIRTL